MATLTDILSGYKIEVPPRPVAIVVDSACMQEIERRVPIGRGRLGFVDGIPIIVDDTIGLARGYIRFSDGHIEKFGAWPKSDPESK